MPDIPTIDSPLDLMLDERKTSFIFSNDTWITYSDTPYPHVSLNGERPASKFYVGVDPGTPEPAVTITSYLDGRPFSIEFKNDCDAPIRNLVERWTHEVRWEAERLRLVKEGRNWRRIKREKRKWLKQALN